MNSSKLLDADLDQEKFKLNMTIVAAGSSLYLPLGIAVMLGSTWNSTIFISYIICSAFFWCCFALGFAITNPKRKLNLPLEFCFYVAIIHQFVLLHATHVEIVHLISAMMLFGSGFVILGTTSKFFLYAFPIIILTGLLSLLKVDTQIPVLSLMLGYIPLILFAVIQGVKRYSVWEELKINKEKLSHAFQSSRLSSLAQMASGVAHEVNNPLAIILASAEQLEDICEENLSSLEKNKSKEQVTSKLATIKRNAERISLITHKLRSISNDRNKDTLTKFTTNDLIRSCLDLCSEKIKNNGIELSIDATENYPIEVRVNHMTEVLFNLVMNSFDAVRNREKKWIKINVAQVKNFVEISIVDSGLGIPKNVASKLFDPFFTTKPVGSGTGLGLSAALGTLQAHNGTLIYDQDSKNTRFVIKLPIASSTTELQNQISKTNQS